MSQAESLSDSDSNTSSSWIFVDECSTSNEPEKNKYYLNCSSEPIQELTSQCLNSMSLETETDSDGISVISESDEAKENSSNEDIPVIEDIKDVPLENLSSVEKSAGVKDEYYFNKYVVLGWIVIAVMTPLLLNYVPTYIEEVLRHYHDDTPVDFSKSDLSINDRENNQFMTIKLNDEMDIRVQQMLEQRDNVLDKKKKYDSKGEVDIHRLDCKEHLCEEPNINNNKKKANVKKNKNIKNDSKKKLSSNENILNSEEIFKNQENDDDLKLQKFDHSKGREEGKKQKLEISEVAEIKDKSTKKKKVHKKKEFIPKSNDFPKKKNKNNKTDNPKHNKKKKNDKEKKIADSNKDYQKEIKKLRKLLEHKEKEIRELTKLVKMKDKHLIMLEYKILKELNILRKPENKDNLKKLDDRESFENKLNSTSGEWYYRLYEGRSKFRNQQHASDWVFDRADFRNKRRNWRNNWYWNWMSDREQLRLKKGFWQFTY